MEPTHTRLSVMTCTLVSRYVHLYTRATSTQSFVQGDRYLGLPDTDIYGVTEQTCPDMPFLCKTTVSHSSTACQTHCQQIPESRNACKHRMSVPSYTLGRQPFAAVGRRQSPRQHVAELLYQSARRHRTSDHDTFPFPRPPRSGGARQYKMYGVRRPVTEPKPPILYPFPASREAVEPRPYPNARWQNMPYDVTSHKGVTILQPIADCTAARK